MKIKAKAGLAVLLLSVILMPASAAISNTVATAGQTLTVSGLPPGSIVQFIINGGVPIFAVPDANGNANFRPSISGATLDIVVMQGGQEIYSATTTVQAPPVSGPSGGGGSGGSTGGGGVVAAEPFDNILKYLTIEASLIANVPVSFNFNKVPELGVYELLITGKESENDIAMRVEVLKGTSKLVTAAPPGSVYKNINVWAGSKRIQSGLVRFKVDNNWISTSGGGSGDVKLLKWDGAKWIQLDTKEVSKDGAFTNFESPTETFSNFAISNVKGVGVPGAGAPEVTVTGAVPTEAKPPAPPTATPKASGIAVVYVMILLVFVSIAIKNKSKK